MTNKTEVVQKILKREYHAFGEIENMECQAFVIRAYVFASALMIKQTVGHNMLPIVYSLDNDAIAIGNDHFVQMGIFFKKGSWELIVENPRTTETIIHESIMCISPENLAEHLVKSMLSAKEVIDAQESSEKETLH